MSQAPRISVFPKCYFDELVSGQRSYVGWTLTEGEHKVKVLEGKGEDWLREAAATRPWGRLLSPDDVADAVEYFATDRSALVTGAILDLEQYPVGAPPNW